MESAEALAVLVMVVMMGMIVAVATQKGAMMTVDQVVMMDQVVMVVEGVATLQMTARESIVWLIPMICRPS